MSQDLSDSKRGLGSVHPELVYDSAPGFERVEPLLTADEFKSRFLWGIPLVSPLTKEKLSKEQLVDYVKRGMNQLEFDSKVEITPVARRERLPFDPNLYYQSIRLEIAHKPIQKVIRLAICSANYRETPNENAKYPVGGEIYVMPNEWIEMANAIRGVLHVNPLNPAFTAVGTNVAVQGAGANILHFLGQSGWVPAYWVVEATFGFCSEDGQVPVIINEMIGQAAAMKLIDNLFPLYKATSQSLSMDGLGQSVSDSLATLLKTKRDQLAQDYAKNVKRLKTVTGGTILSTNV